MRPVTLLLILVSLATVAGAVLYGRYQHHLVAERIDARSLGAEAPPAPSADMAQVQKDAADLKEQIDLLKKENENLQAAVKKLSESAAPTTAADAKPETTAVKSGGNSPEALARQVEEIRQLKFKTPLKFVPATGDEIEKRYRAWFEAQIPPAEGAARLRAAGAMGLAGNDPFVFHDALTGLALEQAGGFYDASTHEMLYDQTADFTARPDLKGRLVNEIAHALLRQHHPDLAEFGGGNDDRSLTNRALVLGDAVAVKIHYGVVDALNTDYGAAQQPMSSPQFTGAPLFMRERYLFPYMMGSQFSQDLQGEGGPSSLAAVYARPPVSTAEIMHPELWKQKPPFQPVTVELGDPALDGKAPYFTNTMGEFGTFSVLRRRLEQDAALEAASGWAGDRYLCFEGEPQRGDHAFWRTVWEDKLEAREFMKAIQTVLLHRYGIPANPRYEQPDGGIVLNDPYRIIRIRLAADEKTVNIIDATDAAIADAMEARWMK